MTAEELTNAIMNAPVTRCDEPAFTFLAASPWRAMTCIYALLLAWILRSGRHAAVLGIDDRSRAGTPHRRGPPAGGPHPGELVDRIIRVDHAGEYGAKRIYEGQLAILNGKPEAPVSGT